MYSLFIRRYRRHLNFNSITDLKAELSGYFTQREIKSGIVDRLVNFNTAPIKDGYCKNSYQDFEVCWYPLLDTKEIDLNVIDWLGEYGLTRIVLNSKEDFYAMMDYFNVVWGVYDNTIEEPKEYPYTMMVASGHGDWIAEYHGNLKEELQKALEQLG